MRIHFISIGGSIMHNLAICLKRLGNDVTGSDDEIYDPARSRLEAEDLLPKREGWFRENIHSELDLVILGMHARANNPELEEAQLLGLNVVSFPEYVGEVSKYKRTVVVAGSHGKTTTTSMIMHCLRQSGLKFDFLVGAQLEGFDVMVQLSEAPILVVEGDEYLSSAIDRRPKFMHYDADILVLTGIAWDHMNVFPTEEFYIKQFSDLLENCKQGTEVYYYAKDEKLSSLSKEYPHLKFKPYSKFEHSYVGQNSFAIGQMGRYPVQIFGGHNFSNLKGAALACNALGIDEEIFLESMANFSGAHKRMNLLASSDNSLIFRDFAHAPSKVRAAVQAVRERYPEKNVIACAELHTYSSLNKAFLPNYGGTLAGADLGAVYYSPKTLEVKKMPPVEIDEMGDYFQKEGIFVTTEIDQLKDWVEKEWGSDTILLLMSSGHFGGLNMQEWAEELISKK